jgi:hypothetical protein
MDFMLVPTPFFLAMTYFSDSESKRLRQAAGAAEEGAAKALPGAQIQQARLPSFVRARFGQRKVFQGKGVGAAAARHGN